MTRHQHVCLAFLRRWFRDTPLSPSVREIAAGIGLTVGPTHRVLLALREQGLITWPARHIRAIRLLPAAEPGVFAAANAVLAAIVTEDLARGLVTVRADAIGALDLAVADDA